MKKSLLILLLLPTLSFAIGGAISGAHLSMPSDGSESARAYTEGVNTNPDFQPTNAEVNQHFDGNTQQIGAYRQGQTVSNELANEP